MDRVMRPGGITTDEGLSAAVRAGMQHLAAHQGDVRATLASIKTAGAAGQKTPPTPQRPWTHKISQAEADRLFVAACHAAAREAAQSPAFHARTDQRRELGDAAKIARASNDRPEIVSVTMAEIAAHNGDTHAAVASVKAADARTTSLNFELVADDGTPGNNQAQNAQINAIVRTLGLTKDQRQQLHIEISGQNYGYQEILQIAKEMFGK
jgi:hypothetical protein